jgi:hypothetical protein
MYRHKSKKSGQLVDSCMYAFAVAQCDEIVNLKDSMWGLAVVVHRPCYWHLTSDVWGTGWCQTVPQ